MSVQIDSEKGEVREERTLRNSGDSVVVSIPPEVLDQAGLGEGDDVDVATAFGSSIIELREKSETEAEE